MCWTVNILEDEEDGAEIPPVKSKNASMKPKKKKSTIKKTIHINNYVPEVML